MKLLLKDACRSRETQKMLGATEGLLGVIGAWPVPAGASVLFGGGEDGGLSIAVPGVMGWLFGWEPCLMRCHSQATPEDGTLRPAASSLSSRRENNGCGCWGLGRR